MMRPDAKVEKVYLYPKPVDFRKSIDGLSALVELDIKVAVFVGADAEVTQLPRFHCPSLTPRKSLSVLDFWRFGDGAVLRRQLGQSRGSANS